MASAPVNSTLARVVSKWALLGTTLPGPPMTENRIFSAARPWWVGMTCLNGKSFWTALEEAIPGRRAGVALVAVLDRRPLVAAHRARARVGQQVDDDVVGVDVEQVVAAPSSSAAWRSSTRRHPDRLDRMDAERLDDRLPAVHGTDSSASSRPRRPAVCHKVGVRPQVSAPALPAQVRIP